MRGLDDILTASNGFIQKEDEVAHDKKVTAREKLELLELRVNSYRELLDEAIAKRIPISTRDQQDEKLAIIQQSVQKIRQNFERPEAQANQVPMLLRNRDPYRNDVLATQDAVVSLRNFVYSDITRRIDQAQDRYRTSSLLVYICSASVLVLLPLLAWMAHRSVLRPIRKLHRAVMKLANADMSARVQVNSGDELQELGQSFNDMADKLQHTYDELNHKVDERSRQLIRSERLASVGFLAAGVAHEINNPLASIAFCSEAIESRLLPVLPTAMSSDNSEVIKNYLQMIQKEAFRCKSITERLLDFSRVGEPERTDTDLTMLVRSVLEMAEHLGKYRGKRAILEPSTLISAKVNPQELKQVLLNLVVNGLESIDQSGEVRVSIRSLSDQVEIRVRDNGCGMTKRSNKTSSSHSLPAADPAKEQVLVIDQSSDCQPTWRHP